ncbi:MAG: hypothetical protein ACREKH_10920, partial [Candidatus Rokuibacteriota bacterium]
MRLLEEHVLEMCDCCGREQEAYAKGLFDGIPAIQRGGEEWRRAGEDVEALLALPKEKRREAIQRARQRFRSPAFAHQLVDRSFAALPQDPGGSLEFATLALTAAAESGSRGMGTAHVLALAHQGNALRALGRLPEAGGCLDRARRLIQHGVGSGERLEVITDPAVYATVSWWDGLYLRELGKWEPAEERLNRAVMFFAMARDAESVQKVVLSLSVLYLRSGNVDDALQAVVNVLEDLKEEDDPGLYWRTRFNYAGYLVEAGLFETGQHELAACLAAPGFPRDSFMKRRVQWLGGRIDRELGDLAAAEPKLTAVRAGYLEEGSGINMALATVDLALVYLAQGRTADVKRVAEELTLIFQANDIQREAIEAMILFQEAVRQEQVTAARLLRLRKYLEST